MPLPLVSCIVPVFNGEKYLASCLDSILGQTHPEMEVVVVDDGSTDRTAEIMASYSGRIIPLSQARSGPTAARNLGLREAQGAFLSFLDADDLWLPAKVELQLRRFQEVAGLGSSFTLVENFSGESMSPDGSLVRGTTVPGYSVVTLLAGREVFESMGPFNEDLQHAADTDWIMRADEKGVVRDLLPEVLVRRRIHDHNRSTGLSARSQEEYLTLLRDHLARRRGGAAEPSRSSPQGGKGTS